MKNTYRWMSFLMAFGIAFCLLLGSVPQEALAQAAPKEKTASPEQSLAEKTDEAGYFDYYNTYNQQARPAEAIVLAAPARKSLEVSGVLLEERNANSFSKGAWAEWDFSVPSDGVYSLYVRYYPLEGNGRDVELAVLLDGRLPYTEAGTLSLPRFWTDAITASDGSFDKDLSGNEMRPKQIETPRWGEQAFKDVLGMYAEPYLFFLEKGTHTLRLECGAEPVALEGLSFENRGGPISYAEYREKYADGPAVQGSVLRQEAEKTYEKNSNTLYPTNDRSDVATVPSDPYYTRLNTVGGSSWNSCGDAISWRVAVEEEGWYRLAFRVRQNLSDGMNSYRRLYINGEIPFQEAEKLVFTYDADWYVKTLGDDRPLELYLKKGDILTLECTSGPMDLPLREVQQAVLKLNALYRDVIMITGSSPSIYQDYNLESQLPELVSSLNAVCDRLDAAVQAISTEMGSSSAGAATIAKAAKIFRELAEDPFFLPDRLSSFKTNIEGLASLLLTLGGQSLELDCIYYIPENASVPDGQAGFWDSCMYTLRRLVASYTKDYGGMGVTEDGKDGAKTLNVWAGLGRDQAQVLNRLIEESFTLETGIPVQLNLVSGDGTLIKATLAGKGPDVCLTVGYTTPINLAARGALAELSKYGLSKLEKEIYPSAWSLFSYQNGIYAIPENQVCDLLFYRTDIFDSLGLTPPDTWEEFYRIMETLQSKGLQVAWPEINSGDQGNSMAINAFNKFLFQNGGEYYTADLSKTRFDTEAAYSAFEKTVELYRTYGLTRDVNVFNRFRSGEMPMAIYNYTLYTQLQASAPEIRGLWNVAMIPGTPQADGSLNRTDGAGASGCVMMKTTEERGMGEAGFRFLEWWGLSEAQTAYGQEMEGILGVLGRTTPANRIALKNLGWTAEEYAILDAQLSISKNPEQVVGNYQVSRSLTSAIRAAINDENTPRRSLQLYNKDINDEIARKRKEFHLD